MAEAFGEQQTFFCVCVYSCLGGKKKSWIKMFLAVFLGIFFRNSAEVRASYWITDRVDAEVSVA